MKPTRWLRRAVALAGIGAVGSATAVTTRYLWQIPQPLRSGLAGEGRIDREHSGDVYYTVAGPTGASPLVLLHDFYPGASSYEFASVLPRFARDFRVFAPDWLGFGMSEHPSLAYTGEFYAGMLEGFLRDVVSQPATVIAHGRAANIAARTASDAPTLFDRLVLVSPQLEAGLHLDPTLAQALVRLAERVSLGLVPYALLSTRPALRLLASRRGMGAASEDVLDHEWSSAHQFGAQHAALAALTGELDLPLQHVLPTLEPPVLLVTGERDARRSRDEMEELAVLRPYADLDIVPGAGAVVCQDQPARFTTTIKAWMERELVRHASTDTLRMGSPEATTVGAARPVGSAGASQTKSGKVPNGSSASRVAPSNHDVHEQPENPLPGANDGEIGNTPPQDEGATVTLATRRAAGRQTQKRAANRSATPEAETPDGSSQSSSSPRPRTPTSDTGTIGTTRRNRTRDEDVAAEDVAARRAGSSSAPSSPDKPARKSAPNTESTENGRTSGRASRSRRVDAGMEP